MTAEGVFPKINGDILYPSEANAFEDKLDTPIYSDTTEYNVASTGSFQTVRTLTIGGGFSGKKLIIVGVRTDPVPGGSTLSYRMLTNSSADQVDSEFIVPVGLRGWKTISLPVSNGDVLLLQLKATVASDRGIVEHYVYASHQALTVTGS